MNIPLGPKPAPPLSAGRTEPQSTSATAVLPSVLGELPTLAQVVSTTARHEQLEIRSMLRDAAAILAEACRGSQVDVRRFGGRKATETLHKDVHDLLGRATELYQAGMNALSKVDRLTPDQTKQLTLALSVAREAFWTELHAVPFVARQRVKELGDIVRENRAPGLLRQARGDRRTSTEIRSLAQNCLKAYSNFESKRAGGPTGLREAGISKMLAGLPPVPELLLERGSEVRRKTERLVELEAKLLSEHGALGSSRVKRDPHYGEYRQLCSDLGGGASHAQEQFRELEAAWRPYKALKDYLYLANIGLSRSGKWQKDEELSRRQDLYQGAAIGLLKAVERYEPGEKTAFATCADSWVKQSRSEAQRLSGSGMVIPAHMLPAYHALLDSAAGPGDEELIQKVSSRYKVDPETVRSLGRIARGFFSVENSQKDSSVDGSVAEALMDNSSDSISVRPFEPEELQRAVAALDYLSPRYRHVVEARLGMGSREEASLTDLAKSLGVSKERVRQIYLGALKKLRAVLAKKRSKT